MVTHSADVASAMFQNIHSSGRCDLSRSCWTICSVTMAVSTIRNALIIDPQVGDLGEESLLSTHWKLLVIANPGMSASSICNCILIFDRSRSPNDSWTTSSRWNGHVLSRHIICSIIATDWVSCTTIYLLVRLQIYSHCLLLWCSTLCRNAMIVLLVLRVSKRITLSMKSHLRTSSQSRRLMCMSVRAVAMTLSLCRVWELML